MFLRLFSLIEYIKQMMKDISIKNCWYFNNETTNFYLYRRFHYFHEALFWRALTVVYFCCCYFWTGLFSFEVPISFFWLSAWDTFLLQKPKKKNVFLWKKTDEMNIEKNISTSSINQQTSNFQLNAKNRGPWATYRPPEQ